MKDSKRLSSIMILAGVFSPTVNAASNIDTTNKYAWSTNSGWLNFNATHGGVTVYNDHLEGNIWVKNLGWIRLGTHTSGGSHTYKNNDDTDYGVNHDGAGNLSGYAWGSNIGWINFNPSDSQVTIDPATGHFEGYAWAKNVGWIQFKNDNPPYKVSRLLPRVDLSVSPNTGTEADTTEITVTATASAAVTGAQTVKLAATGTGITESDYTLNDSTITILDGKTSGTATFIIKDDNEVEGDETATLTISNPSTGILLGTTSQNITITNNDTPPEMNVKGNNHSITDGDTSPATTDHTNFGNANISSGSVERTFTIENSGTTALTLGANAVSIGGSHAADFTVTSQPATSVGGASHATFTVQFNPNAIGVRTASISINNDDSDENPYDFAIEGIGTASLTINTPSHGTVISDGSINCGSTCTEEVSSSTATLTATADTNYTFAGWGGNCSGTANPLTLTMDANKTCSATFQQNNENTGNENTGNENTGNENTGNENTGNENTGNENTGNGSSSTENQNQNTQATQPLPAQMSLFVKMTGLGFGQVKSQPAGINCQTAEEECKATFKTGTTVKLTAMPDTGSEFSSWSGHSDCYDGQVFLTSSRTCEASFKLGPRTLTIVPAEQGIVSSQPEGISCGLDNPACTFTFDGGSKITLAATPNAGWLFDGWEGEGCKNVLTLTQNLTCQPRFSVAPATPEDLQLTQPDGRVITEITPSHTTIGQPMTQTITLTNNGATEMVLSDLTLPPGFQLTSPLPEKIAVGDSLPLQVQLIAESEGVLQGNLSFNVNDQPVNYPLTGTVTAACADSTRLYVNQTAVGKQTGCNWLDAMPQLQTALTAIRDGQAVKEIWIAKGTYKPTEDLNREASFALIDNLAIYGGFAGVETQLAERNSSENQTILSGDIGVVGDNSDNSFHVVTSAGNQATAVLNGLIITAGNANGEGDQACGGGIFNDASQPTFKHLWLKENTAVNGGGICNQNASKPLITESMLENNTALQNGGGVFNDTQSQPRFAHVFISHHQAGNQGGGLMNQNGSQPVLTHINLNNNTASVGGGMLNDNSNPLISHSILRDNTASEGGGMVNLNQSAPQLSHVILSGNTANFAGAMLNQNSSPTLVQTTITKNSAPTGSGLVNQAGSQLLINNSIIWNNTANTEGLLEPQIIDENAQTVVNYSIVQGGWLGQGNLDTDPLLTKVDDPIVTHTTVSEFHLMPNSPAIDAGNNDLLPLDFGDAESEPGVNGDGNTSELIEIDFDGKPRLVDGNGDGFAQVDLGAFEAPATALTTYPLTLTIAGTGAGSVTTGGMVCGDECQQDYPGGQQIMLIAQAANGSQFMGWFGDCTGTAVQIEVEMTRAQHCQAQFDLIPTETTPSTDEETSTPVVTPPPTTTPPTTTTPVEPTVVMPIQNNCPTTGNLQIVCNAGGQVVTDLVVKEGGDLSNGIVETTLTNQGRVANLTITETGSVTGGTVTGLTHNQGMMSDFEFVGYKIEGQNKNGEIKGRLAGRILNRSSLPNAYFKNLRLAQNTHIEGNIILKGHILGEETAPATLNSVIIETGTHIANAVIEKGVTIKPKATLENVTLQGLEVEQVTLSGHIQNSGGRFHQVKLGPKAQVSGGTFSGTITGEAKAPALIEETTIEAGTRLSHVRIGKNVTIADEVIFGAGVEFLNSPTCETKAIALHPEAAEPIESTACFTGKLEIAEAEDVKLSFTMTPPIEAMGQPGEILIVVIYQPEGSPAMIWQRHGAKWRRWNGKPANLTTVERINALPYRLNVEIFEGDLSGLPGRFTLYTGIQLADETIHFNQEAMSFEIE